MFLVYIFSLLLVSTNFVLAEEIERITSILGEPFLMLKRDYVTYLGNEIYEGYSKDLADMLSTKLNFTYKLSLVKDSKYGRLTKGSWNGMIGELLEHGGADMVIAPLTITKERRTAVDFSTPFLEFQLGLLLRKPGFGSNGSLLSNLTEANSTFFSQRFIFRPVSGAVWSVLFALLTTVICISFFIELVFVKKLKNTTRGTSFSGKALQFIFWIFLALFFAAYVGSLVSYRIADILGVNHTVSELLIKSVADLASQDHIRFGPLRAGSTYDYFRVSPDRIHRKLYSSMTRDKSLGLPKTIEEGVERVRYGTTPYAFIMESPYAEYQTSLKPCNVLVAPNFFGPKKAFAVATRPGYRLREQINSAVLTMKEHGDLDELEAKWMHGTNACESKTPLNSKVQFDSIQLDLENILEIGFIMPIAIVFSILVAILEVLIARKKEKSGNTHVAVVTRRPAVNEQWMRN